MPEGQENGHMAKRGVYRKYDVRRTDGKDVGPCFVLELTDPRTWPALHKWADTVEAENPTLAEGIRSQIAAMATLARAPESPYLSTQRVADIKDHRG